MSEYPPEVVDLDFDAFGAEDAVRRLVQRLEQVDAGDSVAEHSGELLVPPFAADRDRYEGVATAPTTLVVFGAFATPWSRSLGDVLADVRVHHPSTVAVAWRHYPDPLGHPRAAVFALAAEAAAALGRFWALTNELLRLRHDDPVDLHAAIVRAGLDAGRTLASMRMGTGTERILEDVASAQRSGVAYTPALYINGERYRGELDRDQVSAALRR